jgi:hypothetical protein
MEPMKPMTPMKPMEPMEPMEPMKPLEAMKPMEPMKPMDFGPAWWPADLGQPATSGAQNGTRYAFFPDKQRLAIEQDGAVTVYDSGDNQIGGVGQQQDSGRTLSFSSQNGDVDVASLRKA